MRKKWIFCICLFVGVLLFAGCEFVLPVAPPDDGGQITEEATDREALRGAWEVSVMLEETEGVSVVGENPITVPAGGEVSFEVEVASGYKIDGLSEGAVYENGVVTLKDVWFPTTVQVTSRTLRSYIMSVENNMSQGKVYSSVPGGKVQEDTEITVRATPANGCIFLGYSFDQPLSRGGEIVSTLTEFTFRLEKDTLVYTNYYYVGEGRLLIYDSNGGNEDRQYDIFSNDSVYICPHALANKGYFTREGYVLCGYNTKADGSGTYYGPGWNVPMPESGQITLYAQWMKESPASDFLYDKSADHVSILKYRGSDETVVVPEKIEGLPVTMIKADAFSGCSFKTLYLSRNLVSISAGAVKNCKNFTTLYLCDNVRVIGDGTFSGCDNFSTLYMLACMDPRYSASRNGTYQIKYQRLITAKDPKLVIISGSNSAYGVDSALLEKLTGNKYNVVNYGCNQDTPAAFYIEVASHFLGKGDILLHQPEPRDYQFGRNAINTTTWQIFEGAYDAFSLVDIRQYTNLFSSFASFNGSRMSMTPRSYENYTSETVNQYGDYIKLKKGTTIQATIDGYLKNGGVGNTSLNLGLLTDAYTANLNRAFDMVKAKGARVYISFACLMRISMTAESQTAAHQQRYKEEIARKWHGTVISDPGTYLMDEKYFYNSIFHLNTEGSQVRTANLAKDLMAQFAKEK